jgi:hypothetical protein
MGIRRRQRVRAIIGISAYGVFWSVFWYFHVHDLWSALIGLIQGFVMGAVIWGLNRHVYLQAFVAGGRPATIDERAAALAALWSGQLPAEPRQREVALAYARNRHGRETNPWPVGVIFGLCTLLSAFLGIVYNPWSWLLAGLCAALAPTMIVSMLRERQRARTLLMAPPLDPVEQRTFDG